MSRILQSAWFTALIGCLSYLGVTAAVLTPGRFQGLRTALQQADAAASVDVPSWKFRNPEIDQWVEELRRQREGLALREQQLQELQTRLQTERQELNYATQLVYQLQADFDKNVVRIQVQEIDNLKRQAKVLSSMSPEAAAAVLKEMQDEDAVRILVTMKADEASVILEAMSKLGKTDARRAASFTEKMRHVLPPDPSARAKATP
jgi:flagellar motility protein MotE (MotC chaperone)